MMDSKEEKEKLYYKVQNIIKYAKIDKYINEQSDIKKEGITFFGTFTGKNNLQIEKLRNVKLKIELLESQKIEKKEEYQAEDLMADLYACAITEFGGRLKPEMQNVYDEISSKSNKTNEDIYVLACEKISKGQSYLPVLHQENKKGIFGDIKIQTEFLKLENQKLQNEIILSRGKSQLETFSSKNDTLEIIIPKPVKNGKI